MTAKSKSAWLTACLHYNEPWEALLVKAVKPYIDVVIQTGVASRFCFQRSWERGPHIRLSFKGNFFVLENMLRPNIKEHFNHYFESRPSLLIEPRYPAGFPDEHKWMPNNSVHILEEGPTGTLPGCRFHSSLCEKQYQASSMVVLNILKEKAGNWNYHEMIGAAIKLHLGFAYAAGLSLDEAQGLFQWMMNCWSKENEDVQSTKSNDKHTQLRSFQKIFDLQKKDIVPYHAALWELLRQYRKMDDPAFIKWFHTSCSTSLELGLALDAGKLLIPSHDSIIEPHQPLWEVYASFIQKVNNQLGITGKTEGYLFFSLSQSLKSIQTGTAIFSKAKA